MIMPGRSCVAGIAIAEMLSLYFRIEDFVKDLLRPTEDGTTKPVWANFRILYGIG
jgi:hypothetical protein